MKKIKKAVIAAAGFGTRMLPITKVIQKEMLPILNRPTIDYVVDDCLKAGIEEIIFVVNDRNDQIKKYFTENRELHNFLKKQNKLEIYDKIKDLHSKANFNFVTQHEQDGYGTGVPLMLSQNYLKGEEAFLFLTGDDVIAASHGHFWLQELIDIFHQSDSVAALTMFKVTKEKVSNYGIIKYKRQNDFNYLVDFIEKPRKTKAFSSYANASKYVFSPDIFSVLEKQKPDPIRNELLITDAIVDLSKTDKISLYKLNGKYFDTGNVEDWLKTNIYFYKSTFSVAGV